MKRTKLGDDYPFGLPPLVWDEQLRLIRRAQRGDRAAKDRLVRSYLGLVVRQATRWGRQPAECDDLVQVGLIAVARAIDAFRPKLKNRLSTVVMAFLKNAFIHHRHGESVVRVPLSSFLKTAPPHVAAARDRALVCASIDAPLRQTTGKFGQIGESLVAAGAYDPAEICLVADEEAHRQRNVRRVAAAIERLDARLRFVIRARMAGRTLLAIGNDLGLTRERIRQMELQAHKRLKRLLGKIEW